jgi:hypothetical protein
VSAPISIKFPPDCWHLIQGLRSQPTSPPLAADIGAILSAAPRIEVRMPIPEPRFIVAVTQEQAEALERWLRDALERLSGDRFRRRTCLECISRIVVALRRSEL